MRAERTDLERLDRQFQIINRAGGRCEVPDVLHRLVEKKEFCEILLDEFEVRIAAERRDVAHRAGDEIVNANDLMAARQEQVVRCEPRKPAAPVTTDVGRLFFIGEMGASFRARADEHSGDGADQDF